MTDNQAERGPLDELTQTAKVRLGVAAAQAIKNNLPLDAFGQQRRLNDYADIWGAAARNAVLIELAAIRKEARRG